MNDQAQKVLIDLLQKAVTGIDSAVAFSQAQIPDVVNQLLTWNAASSAMIQVASIICISITIILLFKMQSIIDDCEQNVADLFIGLFMLMLAISGVLFVMFWFNFDWLKIWLAPKLYLIEYAATLVK